MVDVQEQYKKKLISVQECMNLLKPGFRIYMSSGTAIPAKTAREMIQSNQINNYDLEIIQLFTLGDYFTDDACELQKYRLKNFRTGEISSSDLCQGRVDFIPANLVEIPYIFATKSIEVDVAIITMSPPDKRGYMSLGIAIDVARLVIKNARLVIAEVNPNMPVTYGDTSIHIDQVDHIIESDMPLIERERKEFGPDMDRIGWHISNLIQDGSTVVLHVGRMFDAVAHHIKNRRNLGIYTNVVSDWVIDLIESGAISVERPRDQGGQISTSYCYGTRKLYDYVDHNQLFGFFPVHRLADPYTIRKVPNLISIMNVEKIDITGSNIIFHSGDDLLSGYESKFNFAAGTALSGSGKVIFALRSVDQHGDSNILLTHDRDNERMRSTLGATRYVVTEYGIANLFGKSIRERALAIIDIAHPDHRESLLKGAKEIGLLFPDQIYTIENAVNYPVRLETRKTFKDGLEVMIRPIKPTDEDMMRRLFYNFSDEAKYLRYFTNVRVMPHRNMQKYVNVDYDSILSIVAVIQRGHNERIIAEARYAAYPDRKNYDMAFLVDEDFQGKGIATFMLNYLIKIARERGIEKLSATVLAQNEKMLIVFDKAPIKPKKRVESGEIEIEFDLKNAEK